jgi:hypothetical protein
MINNDSVLFLKIHLIKNDYCKNQSKMVMKLQPIRKWGYKMFVKLFVCVLALSVQTFAQQSRGSIKGLVKDATTDEPLIGAKRFNC